MPPWGDDLLIALKAVLNAMVYEVVFLWLLCGRVLFGSKENPKPRRPPALMNANAISLVVRSLLFVVFYSLIIITNMNLNFSCQEIF